MEPLYGAYTTYLPSWHVANFQLIAGSTLSWFLWNGYIFIKRRKHNNIYYSFKIFPRFCLAKSTRIIHHNQLLMTRFGKRGNDVKMQRFCRWRQGWVVLVVETKMADISLVSRVRTRQNNSLKYGKNSKKTNRRATSAVWRIFAELNNPKRAISKMNLTSMDRLR